MVKKRLTAIFTCLALTVTACAYTGTPTQKTTAAQTGESRSAQNKTREGNPWTGAAAPLLQPVRDSSADKDV